MWCDGFVSPPNIPRRLHFCISSLGCCISEPTLSSLCFDSLSIYFLILTTQHFTSSNKILSSKYINKVADEYWCIDPSKKLLCPRSLSAAVVGFASSSRLPVVHGVLFYRPLSPVHQPNQPRSSGTAPWPRLVLWWRTFLRCSRRSSLLQAIWVIALIRREEPVLRMPLNVLAQGQWVWPLERVASLRTRCVIGGLQQFLQFMLSDHLWRPSPFLFAVVCVWLTIRKIEYGTTKKRKHVAPDSCFLFECIFLELGINPKKVNSKNSELMSY